MALQSGLVLGHACLVDGLVEQMSHELSVTPTVVATGGLATVVAPCSRRIELVDPDLTLNGIRLLYERNTDDGDN
jgi:type III pantothenate kinase